MDGQRRKIAVMVPCYNEEPTIGKVIDDFRKNLPGAGIYVFDNNSADRTYQEALRHGASCYVVWPRGKGNVVRAMFDTVDADVCVMVDGDDTYEAGDVNRLVAAIGDGYDMAIGYRTGYHSDSVVRTLGNRFVNWLCRKMFRVGEPLDALSGYRAFSRDFMRHYRYVSEGFGIETEMTFLAARDKIKFTCVPVGYRDRPAGSFSKICALRDGASIVWMAVKIWLGLR